MKKKGNRSIFTITTIISSSCIRGMCSSDWNTIYTVKNNMFDHVKCVDLTHVLSAEAPTWNGSCGFFLEKKQDYDQMFRVQQIKMHAGVGTHMDAPCHCIPEGNAIADIPLELLIVPACVIDVSLKAHADYEVSKEDIEEYELAFGKIPKNALVIAYTG